MVGHLADFIASLVDLSLCDGEQDSIYLAGNSLGLMPKATRRVMEEQFKKWGEQ